MMRIKAMSPITDCIGYSEDRIFTNPNPDSKKAGKNVATRGNIAPFRLVLYQEKSGRLDERRVVKMAK